MRPRTAVVSLVVIVTAATLSAAAPVGGTPDPKAPPNSRFVPSANREPDLAKKFGTAARNKFASSAPRATVAGLDPELTATTAPTTAVTVHGSTAAITHAVTAVGGTIVAGVNGAVSADVPTSSLTKLARSDGVASVRAPVKARVDATSQGVDDAGASAWQSAGVTGTGVTVAIVDAGFADLTTEISNGNLPAGTSVVGHHCADEDDTDHGTAVTEIVHQMAPGATLALYCVDDTIGFGQAEAEIEAAGIKIVNSSIAFPGDDRGDGTGGGPDSAGAAVQRARQNGILWIASAGNSGVDHWSGNFAYDTPSELSRLSGNRVLDYVTVGQGQSAEFYLQWDDWPTSNLSVQLAVAASDSGGNPTGSFVVKAHDSGPPTLSQCFAPGGDSGNCIDSNSFPSGGQLFAIGIRVPANIPSVRFDLDYEGFVSPNALSCTSVSGQTCVAYGGTPGSIAQPAGSQYVLAVGAADASGTNACGGDTPGTGPYPLENYSSRGPSIGGLTKPEIAGFDGVVNNLGGTFCGTSAAAPHVAGAAALVVQQHPYYSADQLQAYLTQHADGGNPNSPALNTSGAGYLTLDLGPGGSFHATLACSTRFVIATIVSGQTVRAQAFLSGFSPNQAYNIRLAPPGLPSVQIPTTADSSGNLVFDQTLPVSSTVAVSVGNVLTWSATLSNQSTAQRTGSVVLADGCPALRGATRSSTTYDYDVSGDGYADLLAIDPSGRLLYYPNNSGSNPGHLPFASGTSFGSGWYGHGSPITLVAVGDVSGDGYADLLATTSGGALLYYPNNINSNPGRLPYSYSIVVGSGWQNFTNLAIADVNGDGYADIIASRSDGTLWVYLNAGAHSTFPYGVGTQVASGQQYSTGLAAGDLNGDGFADLVSGNFATIQPNLSPSGPNYFSTSLTVTSLPSAANPGTGIAVGDYEHSGQDGVMIASPGGNGQLLYVKNPLQQGGQTSAAVIGSGWQYIQRIIP